MNNERMEISVPVIATRGIIVFPQQDIMIEVGREKSIRAVEEAEEKFDGHVWLVCQKDIMVDNPAPSDLYAFGTLCRIKNIRRKEGFMRITFSGLERAKLVSMQDEGRLFMATVLPIADEAGDNLEEMALIRRVAKEFENIASNANNFPPEIIAQLTKGVSAPTLSDQFAQYFPLPLEKKQLLLETLNVNERLMMIIQELEKEKQLSDIENNINEKVKERIDESQKEYYLREKLRAIKEELGDVSNQSDDSEELRRMIEENPYPEAIKEKAREELARYEMLPGASGEAGVVRTYLDWLLGVPWWQETEDNEDLKLVQKRLDEDHFGLEKVKDRIMEYLAVKQMTQSLNAPILCLVGPPGVGKTSLAKSVARALDRKFVKASLGGVRDEAEIRGHRRTYLGSLPGRIIQGMKKAGVINPVFLIDEIDKMASDYKGDPSSAMLEVLDPEQNKLFSDNYLEEPYDLSKVMFIATANTLDSIPAALRDRLEIIELSSYTEVEKVSIAQEHLIRKQAEINGLKPSQFKLSDAELIYLIRHYTREAGVRQLERVIASLCRKSVLTIMKDGKRSVKVSKKLIQEWLGKEKFEYGVKEKKDQIGVVTGLAYTSFGGDILPVEVTYFDGKGKLIVTGQLGDVMKESTEIALDYIKSRAVEYKIDPAFFDKHDIHIHCPEGAVPKDGPSAGVTLTTALVSAITRHPVHANLAMTGEVTLRGNVLPIGGLREKSLAAHRSGISTVIIPKNNVKDLDEVPETVKNDIHFIPVETVDQVIQEALVR
ncbi:endopeptidase La [Holdemania massiliensis]|uniref:Lon protease n=1 Tax=Holdemania massiliensis TaxID=1468449 RepID=A0A6N7SBP7_9FIRM|nr:endopeptidase La [Holdemania massiliensis]MSA73105.1 endopeptidase La [Holdemania massiliensis]MSA91277.1 endopeptidase La [Holdemania massiliensis]MSB80133.1 endopeptidase La [Holdemania massiliensis]MSC35077.1 endopeptidase La [Holdemania massiliensis]MSC41466.1 endopeptidase La [Holdemania massiliensis]